MGLYLISTLVMSVAAATKELCQCPLGLIPHFYRQYLSLFKQNKNTCQCPLGLIPHFYGDEKNKAVNSLHRVNALTGLYLISTYHCL